MELGRIDFLTRFGEDSLLSNIQNKGVMTVATLVCSGVEHLHHNLMVKGSKRNIQTVIDLLVVIFSIRKAFGDNRRRHIKTGGSPVTLDADTLFLDNYLKPIWIAEGSVQPREAVRYQDAITESNALTDLLTTLSGGALMAHYQGHANSYLLCSEYWFQDMNRSGFRNDVQSLTNSDSPWVFFGMGCHVSDWAQDTVAWD